MASKSGTEKMKRNAALIAKYAERRKQLKEAGTTPPSPSCLAIRARPGSAGCAP